MNTRALRRPTLGLGLLALVCAGLLGCSREPASTNSEDPTPQRIASRTVLSDEVLWALGEDVQTRVVGLSPMADDARYSTVAGHWPASVTRLGRNPEELLAIAPDLVILASFSDAEYRAAISDHTRLLVLDDFSGFDDYLTNIEAIGQAVGAPPERITALRERFEQRRADLEARRAPPEQRPSVIAWDYGHVPGIGTTFDDAATTAGFRNLASEQGLRGHKRLDVEQLVAWDPDWIVIGCGEQDCAKAIETLAEQPGLRRTRAVESGKVIAIEAPWLATSGEGMLELAERMQEALSHEQDLARG